MVRQQFCNLTPLKDGVTGLTHHDQMHSVSVMSLWCL